jgi:hypothetical protein
MRLNGEYFMIVGEKQDDLLYFDAWGQGLIWIPQQPEDQRGEGSAGNTRVLANGEHQRTALL